MTQLEQVMYSTTIHTTRGGASHSDRHSFHATFLAAASAFGLLLLAASSYAQTVTQKEITMTQLDTVQLDPVPYTAPAAVRPFVTFALSGETREGLFRSL